MAWRLHLLLVTQVVLLDGETTSKTSVVCIDSRMPLSAEKVAKVMLEEWRDLRDSWDYVEGSVDVIIPASSTVLVAVHACGILSDKAISLAIQGNSPLVLVPCCHTKKSLSQEQRRQMIYLPSVSSFSTPTSMTNLAEIIDKYRVQRLQDTGMKVQEAYIPEIITPKNRIFLATPLQSTTNSYPRPTKEEEDAVSRPKIKIGNKTRMPKAFIIPLGDDIIEARAKVRSLAGSAAANEKKQQPPPTLCLSVFLPLGKKKLLPLDRLVAIAQSTPLHTPTPGSSVSSLKIEVQILDTEAFLHPSGSYDRTFSVCYQGVAKEIARYLHTQLQNRIPEEFPGANVRK